MNRVLMYVEEHHEEYGVALFVIPVLLGAFALVSVGCVLCWVFG
ncbi:MAG: hypothetical protein JWQ07_625 [Ramlibacter sp.]|nr:hypothetical protein [Ramlibacter sp.]